ncbi:hypothetical protein Pcinc_003984 [Petrolisthes cinctipes]|uniref:PiggyBac transposable element-derived protein domain-containing protein n=1 Tax=Petrolisthes cinctipes TaxID=88211 RepID=A0AAE1L1J2_PETCI|nr:hypothetical protein Pcinc_003984 [Petrolisthes cinctipes]
MEDGGSESGWSESDVIGSDEVWLGNNALSSSSDEDEGNENDGTSVNLREVFSFDWSEGSDFVPDQHDFRPNRSGTTRDWPCNDEARESAFFRAFIDEEVMSYIAEKTNRYNSWVSQHMDFISPFSRIRNWEATTVRELFVFLALMLIMPLCKKHVLQQYWRKDALISTPLFSKYMPRDRFLLLLSFLHFSENEKPNKEDRIWKKSQEETIDSGRQKPQPVELHEPDGSETEDDIDLGDTFMGSLEDINAVALESVDSQKLKQLQSEDPEIEVFVFT